MTMSTSVSLGNRMRVVVVEGPSESELSVRRSTLIITNLIKMAGAVLCVREMLMTKDIAVMAVCVLMMGGVQSLENAVVLFAERLFAMPPRSED